MIPAIRREAVERRGWMNEEEISDCIAISQALPGAFAVNSAVFIGKKAAGIPGALAAVFGVTFPAALSILVIVLFLGQIEDNVYVQGALEGIMAAAVALILVTVWQMARTLLDRKLAYAIAALSFLLIIVLGLSVIWAVLAGGLIGFLESLYLRRRKGRAQ